MQSGDLLLFRGNCWYSRIIEYFSGSVYSHAGIYIQNPATIGVALPDGDYILHSGYGKSAETGELVYGVHIQPLEEVLKEYPEDGVDVRMVHAERTSYFYRDLAEIHSKVHHLPYDTCLVDWLSAAMGRELLVKEWYKNTHRFWCSALVAYVYSELGWVSDVDWTLVSPGQLAGACLRWRVPVESPKKFK